MGECRKLVSTARAEGPNVGFRCFDAGKLWEDPTPPQPFAKFVPPTIANGRVYRSVVDNSDARLAPDSQVNGHLLVYALLSSLPSNCFVVTYNCQSHAYMDCDPTPNNLSLWVRRDPWSEIGATPGTLKSPASFVNAGVFNPGGSGSSQPFEFQACAAKQMRISGPHDRAGSLRLPRRPASAPKAPSSQLHKARLPAASRRRVHVPVKKVSRGEAQRGVTLHLVSRGLRFSAENTASKGPRVPPTPWRRGWRSAARSARAVLWPAMATVLSPIAAAVLTKQ